MKPTAAKPTPTAQPATIDNIEAKRFIATARDTYEHAYGLLSQLHHDAEAIALASAGRERTPLESEALYLAKLAAQDAKRVDLTRQ
jgi:hypothetical protein